MRVCAEEITIHTDLSEAINDAQNRAVSSGRRPIDAFEGM